MIVHMDEQIHSVEGILATVGRDCNSRILERKNESIAKLQHVLAGQGWYFCIPLWS